MPSIRATIAVRLGMLRKFREILEQDLRLASSGPIRAALREWRRIYWEFINERFEQYSRGSGDWPALAPSTVKRKAKLGLDPRILVATRLLEANLDPQFSAKPGALNEDIPFGVRVRFGSDDQYPGGQTVREVAMFHQLGGPSLPQRKIIAPPDQEARDKMRAVMRAAIKEAKLAARAA